MVKATAVSSQISLAQKDLLDFVAPLELGRKALNNSAVRAVVNEKIGKLGYSASRRVTQKLGL